MEALQAYGWPLDTVKPFKYLVKVLTETYNNLIEVIVNLLNDQKIWIILMQILGWEGMDSSTLVRF